MGHLKVIADIGTEVAEFLPVAVFWVTAAKLARFGA